MFTVNGKVALNGQTFYRIDKLNAETPTGIEFLQKPAILVRDNPRLAQRVCELLNADSQIRAAAPDLLAALHVAKRTIRTWHGLGLGSTEAQTWALYQASPEMTEINGAIAKAEVIEPAAPAESEQTR